MFRVKRRFFLLIVINVVVVKYLKKIFNKIYKNLKYIEILKKLGLADIFTVLSVIVRQQIY